VNAGQVSFQNEAERTEIGVSLCSFLLGNYLIQDALLFRSALLLFGKLRSAFCVFDLFLFQLFQGITACGHNYHTFQN